VYGAAAAAAFLLELCALAALSYSGYVTGSGVLRYGLAAVLPLLAAVVWGLLAAPRARVRLETVPKTAVRLLVLLGSAVALAVAGSVVLAVVFAVVVLANTAVLAALGRPVPG
jgi:Protein of unknown function (DUF2568)